MAQDISRADQKANTRQDIEKAARAVFGLYGFTGSNLRLIADTAKLSTGAIFCHFTSKGDLWRSCMGSPEPDALAFIREIADGNFKLSVLRERAATLALHLAGTVW